MPLGLGSGTARGRSRALGLCALLSLGACSLINHFDDVKPGTPSATGLGGMPSSSSSTTANGGAGGAATGAGGDTAASGAGGVTTTGNGGGGATTSGPGGSGGGVTGGAAGSVGGSSSTGGAAGTIDAGFDAGPPRILSCRFVIGSAMGGHRKLDDFSGLPANTERTIGDKIFMLPTGNGTSVRILAQLNGQQTTYLEYFASDTGGTQMPMVITSGGRLMDARKIDMNTSGALVLSQVNGQPPQLMFHRFDDANMNPTPGVSPVTNQGDLGSSGQVEARMAPALDGTMAVAMSFQTSPTMSRAAFGLYSGTPVTVVPLFDDPNQDAVRPTGLMRLRPASQNYAFYGDLSTSQVEYQIPDGARTLSDTTHRTVPGPAFVLMADPSPFSMGKLNLVAVDLDFPMQRWFKLFLGQNDVTQVLTFDPNTLPLVRMSTSLLDTPIGSLNGLTDDMLLFAGPTGMSRKELSLWFIDIWGQTRVEQKLADTPGEVSAGLAFPRGNIGGPNNKYHLVWAEKLQDGSGANYNVLWYDQVECL